MREFYISDYGAGVTVSWRAEDGKRFAPTTVPHEIEEHVSAIWAFTASSKTDEQLALEEALDFVLNKATDEEKVALVRLFPQMKTGEHITSGTERAHEGVLYRAREDFIATPDFDINKWDVVGKKKVDVIEWFEPTSVKYYKFGDVVRYLDGKLYKSKLEVNVWSPVGYPNGWDEVVE